MLNVTHWQKNHFSMGSLTEIGVSEASSNTMDHHLVRSDHDANQDYKFSQKEAYHHRTTSNSPKKRTEEFRGMTKTILLAHGSLYIHTAYDGEMYYHSLDFAKQSTTKNRVRVVFVFWWLAVPTFFCQNTQDNRCNCFSTIDKHAFESIDSKKGQVYGGKL